jgi:hypothetical protein
MTTAGLAARLRSRPLESILGLAVALVAVGVLVTLPDLVDSILGYSDAVVPITMAEQTLATHGTLGTGITGDHPWFIGFWAVLVLLWAGLPTDVVVAIPAILWLGTAAGVARYWIRRDGLLSGLIAGALMLCIGRSAWEAVGAWDSHGGTIFLGMVAVTLLSVAAARGRDDRGAAAAVLVAGVAGGLAAHSDALALLSVVVPGAVALLGTRAPILRLSAAAVGLVGGYGASALLARMSDLSGSDYDLFLRTEPLDGVGSLYNAASYVWADPRIFSDAVGGSTALMVGAFAAGWIVVLATGIGVVITLRTTVLAPRGAESALGDLSRIGAATGTSVQAEERSEERGHPPAGGDVWTIFWVVGFVLVPLSFVASSASGQDETLVAAYGRYLLPWWVSIAALAPLALRHRSRVLRLAVVGGALVLLGVGGGRLLRNAVQSVTRSGAPAYAVEVDGWWVDNVQHAAARFGATHGYAGYWTAAPLGAGRDVPVFPVMTCGILPAPQLCASGIASRPSMYRRDRGASFIVLDQRAAAPPHAVTTLQGITQRPIGRVDIAPGLTAVFFRSDIGRYVAPYPGQQTTQNGRTG